ncbi:molybdate ABC transporter substrate-binding protein [Yoonia sediminilitoris]|uniref:Molybdate transport system substrate-binding protein n=1 Tax=Yoonia sediminilitoris TaxID=1286148 RepID=A0A2T6KK32_9RHOB|nr:molybdate ABC transporter substrate-binding protein [Yoonia sediminilitoris]PUB16282.1 molybdate transport system substrate-binding protein [Yoonia sediminilitoris]RCW96631.1 molybdate transport system substrate-binding protein [Yoonia sediminilitoris]
MMARFFLSLLMLLSPAMLRADVVVFAAASLKEPVDRLAAEFDDVVVSYAGSGTLARQTSVGAPADLVLLANREWMDVLQEQGFVQADTIADFASNALVLIGPATAADVTLDQGGMTAALGDGRMAVGLTGSVPAGIYAKQALIALDLWDTLSPKLAEVDSVRSALTLVARAETPLGIVYQTDARATDAVRIVARFPANTHAPIRYTGALTAQSDQKAAAFWDFIQSPSGQAVLADAGFLPPMSAQ